MATLHRKVGRLMAAHRGLQREAACSGHYESIYRMEKDMHRMAKVLASGQILKLLAANKKEANDQTSK